MVDNINNDKPDKLNRQLYSSFKLAAEKLIMNYSNHNNKKYFIIRLFNTYGNDKDNFSFIEKIIFLFVKYRGCVPIYFPFFSHINTEIFTFKPKTI